MRAVSCRDATLRVVDLPTPTLERGQLLLDVLACGICGSDLHARHHCDEMADATAETGFTEFMRSDQDVVMGHEFCGRIVEHGPGTRKRDATGTTVVAFPLMRRGGQVLPTGLTAQSPGGYAEQVVVEESLAMAVPNGLHHDLAAMTEPMAVGLHAVRRGEVGKKQGALVIGCGPIGLAVVSMLKATGVKSVVAADYSPARRALATACGADAVVDPAEHSPYASFADRYYTSADAMLDLAVDSMEKLRRLPLVPWQHVMKAAEVAGAMPTGPVVFECVGVPGVIDDIIAKAPLSSRVVVVGVCAEPDRIRPTVAINKEIDLRFVLGYTPREFHQTLHMLADGTVDPTPLLTGKVGLAGVESAFDALGDPETHAKILVDPTSEAAEPVAVR
jgi:threonine dehydrogenase-like Zn-dependent dehydrogenase